MLTKFEVKNFKNFGEKLVFDLTRTNGYEFNKQCVVDGIVHKAIVYGYNGTGKSNLGFALFDLISHLTDRFKGSAKEYRSYLYAGDECKIAEFKFHFKFTEGSVIYEYGKSDRDTLVYEKLLINDIEFASIDRRNSSVAKINASGAETLNKDIGDSKISIISYIRQNSILESNNNNNNCFNSFLAFVNGMLFFRSLDSNQFIGFEQESQSVVADIIEKGNVKEFEDFLNAAGVECKLAAVEGEEDVYLAFDFNGKKIRFYDIASMGTKSLILFYYWYQRLSGDNSKATFLFVDEFDAFYHHSLSTLVIKMIGEIKAQAIVTTHNTTAMTNDLLRPDCYFLMRKDGIHSLSNCTPKELREAHNIEKMYRAGAFSV